MNISGKLEDFLENKGYTCVICSDVYDVKKREKQPTQLSCAQHSICIECLEENGKKLASCPSCREPLTFSAKIVPNSQMISAIDILTELWKQLQNPSAVPGMLSSAAAAASPSPVVEPPKPPVPDNFKSCSLVEKVWEYKNPVTRITEALPSVVAAMKWEKVVNELITEFNKDPSHWVCLVDQTSQETKGIAKHFGISNEKNSEYMGEIHWAGVTQMSVPLYVEFYKALVARFIATAVKIMDPDKLWWNSFSITSCFNYDTERAWFDGVLELLTTHKYRFEINYLHLSWGTQVKLKVFPFPKPGHTQIGWKSSDSLKLVHYSTLEYWIAAHVISILSWCGLSNLFRMCAMESCTGKSLEESVEAMKEQFKTSPENFYIYTIDDKAHGFVKFRRLRDEALLVERCGLTYGSTQYADHFIQQFMAWAAGPSIFAKDKKVKKIWFFSECSGKPAILEAIEKYKNTFVGS